MALPSPRDPEELRGTLASWLSDQVGATVAVHDTGGSATTGFSNETILAEVEWAGERHDLVFRVQPTAHTVFMDDRFTEQHRVMRALEAAGDVPVPHLRWYEEDVAVLGAPFMVMDRVEGEAPTDNPPYSMDGWLLAADPAVQAAVWTTGLDAMAAVHRVDWKGVGLADLDPCPDGSSRLGRRVDEWAEMLAWASPEVRQEIPELGLAWLRENQPPDVGDPALCWGDSRISNQMFAGRDRADTVHVAAVLDWEMVHVGDPIQDLGWFTWLDHTLSSGLDVPRLPGLPSVSETVARWEEATGRSGEHHRWAEINAGVGFAVVMVRLTALLKGADFFPQDSDFERTNMACVALERALAAMDVHPTDLP